MNPLKVLIAEDEALIAILLAEVLSAMGHDVCAIEATEAGTVLAARRWRPDMMIIDARLGHGSGVAAVSEIITTGFIPHLFVTGEPSKVRALRPDAIILQKPFRDTDLEHAIGNALATTEIHP